MTHITNVIEYSIIHKLTLDKTFDLGYLFNLFFLTISMIQVNGS